MDKRYGVHPQALQRMTAEEIRGEFLIEGLSPRDRMRMVYSHIDRVAVLGCMPVTGPVPIDEGIDLWRTLGTRSFLERREMGVFNLGGAGTVRVDGAEYRLDCKDCLYITKGAREVFFASNDARAPAKYYMVCVPAHRSYETRRITLAAAVQRQAGSERTGNRRVIYQFIHPSVLPTCQLSMGLTALAPGSVWNTMPAHTHERRMEVYFYFEVPEGERVFHLMGEPAQTRHIVVGNEEAVISPSWSIHAGCGTASYAFIWAMAGENQAFDDMDAVPVEALR